MTQRNHIGNIAVLSSIIGGLIAIIGTPIIAVWMLGKEAEEENKKQGKEQ